MARSRPHPPALAVGPVAVPGRTTSTRFWWAIACSSLLLTAIVSAWIAATDLTPAFAFDEVHHLLTARMLAGFPAPDGSGAGYFPAWGVLLTPLWWVLSEPRAVYAAALAAGWAVGMATIYPLALLLRRVRLGLPQALTAAALVMMLPARIAQADNVFSERLLLLFMVLAALAAFRLWERPSHVAAVVFALAVGAVYFAHVRMLTVVLASAVWLTAFLLRRWQVAITGLVALAASYAVFDWLGKLIDALLRRNEMGRGASFISHLDQVQAGLLARAALGQVWTQIVGSYGLFAVGLIVLVVWCWREVRAARLGRAAWLAGSLTASFAVSILTWSTPARMLAEDPRLDAWLYGRYVEPITAIVCALALAVILRGIRTRTWVWSLGAALAVIVLTLLFVAPVAPTWGSVTPAHIGGVMPWAWALPHEAHAIPLAPLPGNANGFWFVASATALAFLIVYRMARTPTWVSPLLLTAALVLGAAGVNAASDEYRERYSREWSAVESLRAVAGEFGPLHVAYDYACRRPGLDTGVGMNQLSFALLPDATLTPVFDGEPLPADARVVLSCNDPSTIVAAGARALVDFDIYSSRAWIMPGPLQDELDSRGLLLPTQSG